MSEEALCTSQPPQIFPQVTSSHRVHGREHLKGHVKDNPVNVRELFGRRSYEE